MISDPNLDMYLTRACCRYLRGNWATTYILRKGREGRVMGWSFSYVLKNKFFMFYMAVRFFVQVVRQRDCYAKVDIVHRVASTAVNTTRPVLEINCPAELSPLESSGRSTTVVRSGVDSVCFSCTIFDLVICRMAAICTCGRHIEVRLYRFSHANWGCSIRHWLLQPSPLLWFPSSHSSALVFLPSPHSCSLQYDGFSLSVLHS